MGRSSKQEQCANVQSARKSSFSVFILTQRGIRKCYYFPYVHSQNMAKIATNNFSY